MICRNCGREIHDTARFCQYCGTPVASQEPEQQEEPMFKYRIYPPDEPEKQTQDRESEVRTPYTAPFRQERKKGMFTKVFGTAFRDPMRAVEMSSTDDAFGSGVLYWLIFLFSAGIFSGIGTAKLITVIYELIEQLSGMMSGAGSYSDYGLGSYYSYYGLSQGIGIGAFFAVLFIAAAATVLLLLFIWLMGKAFGGRGSFKRVFAATGPATVYVSAALLVSAIFMAVSAGLGIVIMSIILSAAAVICIAAMIKAFKESMSLSWTGAAFAAASGIAVFAVAVMMLTALIAMA
ncbi:MAG: zinc-ribbon domain-containing protein [Eubacteriaceae bacterium]|jgi:hypothetical protein|nr:zinc-ribbon domain-containing protein [Eubacteriaceae bacterium]